MASEDGGAGPRDGSRPGLRFWNRLSFRLAGLFALVTVLAVVLVGVVVYGRQKREVEDAVGTQLLNIARIGSLLVDAQLHAQAVAAPGSSAYARVQKTLNAIRTEAVLPTPIYTLALEKGMARMAVTGDDGAVAGTVYTPAPDVAERLGWTFEDGVARYTGIYRNARGTWISAFAPVGGEAGKRLAVLVVDYPVEIYLDRLNELQFSILYASIAGAIAALIVGLLVARRITRPISALTTGVARVAEGDLSQALPVRSSDEVGVLTRAFNGMLDGLRQRDFIRNTFGRYVSPEVVKTLLESPEGLRFGGEKRVVTIGSERRAKYAVVGSAVNVAARVEGSTVGGQIFLSAVTYEQLRDQAEVLPPVSVELKGLAAPLLLYELRGLTGRFAQRLPEATTEDEEQRDVALALTCWVTTARR